MSEIARCAWCGKEPRRYDGTGLPQYADYYCNNDECLASQAIKPEVLELWNGWQERILAQRRADFEAGALAQIELAKKCFWVAAKMLNIPEKEMEFHALQIEVPVFDLGELSITADDYLKKQGCA